MSATAPEDGAIAESLADAGFAVTPDFLPAARWRGLAEEARRLRDRGGFRHAGVGRGPGFRVRPEIRSDRVHWIDPQRPTRRQRAWLDRMETLRHALNRALTLGLFGFESHLAVYPPGAFYRTHLDRFVGASHRRVTVIAYLNEGWREEDGGALRLHLEATRGTEAPSFRDVLPEGGTLVTFLADALAHEVLPARRERWSVVGWFTTRP